MSILQRFLSHPCGQFTTALTAASIATLLVVSQKSQVETPANKTPRILKPTGSAPFSTSVKMSGDLEKAKAEALWGSCAGDALSMPVHWYYDPDDIKRGYGGWLTGYRAPNEKHPSSILTLSAIDGSGRTGWHSKSKTIIGDLILHDKLKYWSGDPTTHYHQGMSAGDNTLNTLTAIQTAKTLQRVDPNHDLDLLDAQAAVMEDYIQFMTTPGTHGDTYAESFHRLFFREWASLDSPPKAGKEIVKFCMARYNAVTPSNEDHEIPVIGALPLAVPWAIHYAGKSADECAHATVEGLKLTHPAPSLMPFVDAYARLLHAVLNGADLHEEALKTAGSKIYRGKQKRDFIAKVVAEARKSEYSSHTEKRLRLYQEATQILGSVCYIEGAMGSLLLLAHGFYDNFDEGLLTNTNCAGENVHRGAALGALLAAAAFHQGKPIAEKWKEGLNAGKADVTKLVQSPL